MSKSDSDSDSDDRATEEEENPLQLIRPDILAQMRHLDLSSYIIFKERNFVSGGGYGDIFKGRCKFPDRGKVRVAVKRLRFYLKEDIKMLFEKEIYVWSKLKHNNVLPLLGYAFANEYRYPLLVSEWMDRGSAWSYVKAHLQCNILHLITGIAQGLAYLHEEGVVHSDIKSDNVLVSNSGDALVCDFGGARMTSATKSFVNISTGITGTLRYLAFELLTLSGQTRGHTKESDVWAFGMTTFELLTRQRPYAELSDPQVIVAISRHQLPSPLPRSEYWMTRAAESSKILWHVCLECWNHNPQERPDMKSILKKLPIPISESERHGTQTHVKRRSSSAHHSLLHKLIDPEHRDAARTTHNPLSSHRHDFLDTYHKAHPPIAHATTITSFLDDADPTNLFKPKKEGSDWSSTLNPQARRAVDVELWNTLIHKGTSSTNGSSAVRVVRFSADGRYLATCCEVDVYIYEIIETHRTCVLLDRYMASRAAPIQCLCFSLDAKYLALETEGNAIKIWDISTKRVKQVFHGHHQGIRATEFSKDGQLVISGSADCTARIWNMDTGLKRVLQTKEPPGVRAEITSISISPDAQLIAAGCSDSVVRIWEVQSGNLVERLKGHRDSVSCVAFTPDGRGLLSGSFDKSVKHWDVSMLVSGPVRRLPLRPATKPTGCDHSLDEDKKDGIRPRRELPLPPVEKPPSGAILGRDILAQIACERGERGSVNVMNFFGHEDCVLGVAMSNDGRWIMSVSKDNVMYFIEMAMKQVHIKLQSRSGSVHSVDYCSASGMFAVGCSEMETHLWSYNYAELS